MARKFFDHEQFNFEFQCALGGVHYGAGDIGEMLSTAFPAIARTLRRFAAPGVPRSRHLCADAWLGRS
jgi:hypothetical protein